MAELEVTAEEDAELNRQSKPVVNKLKKLPLLTEVLSNNSRKSTSTTEVFDKSLPVYGMSQKRSSTIVGCIVEENDNHKALTLHVGENL
ncbi:hypothetical protein Sjap_007031 [Stephania japonica]|uniref:Uncharacterized protein n=1 Tax=Stephania japonica TaxID=461633 RepID=A0AAP0PJJ2_9MAGN